MRRGEDAAKRILEAACNRTRDLALIASTQQLPVSTFFFDVLDKDDTPLADRALRELLESPQAVVRTGGCLRVSESQSVSAAERLSDMLQDAISKGLEGVVVKRPDGHDEAGARNVNWVKLKRHAAPSTASFSISSWGRGKPAGFGAGALLVGLFDDVRDVSVTVTRIGTGLTDEEWREVYVGRRTSATSPGSRLGVVERGPISVVPQESVRSAELTRNRLLIGSTGCDSLLIFGVRTMAVALVVDVNRFIPVVANGGAASMRLEVLSDLLDLVLFPSG